MELVVFDLDGTLLDSMPIWQGLGEKYLLQKKLQPAPGLHDALKAMSLPQAAQHFRAAYGLHEDEETIIGEIETLIADLYRYEVPLKAGAAEYLQTLQEQGLATVHSTGITVTEQGWFFIRAVAMVFDKYLQTDRTRAKFSKII